MQFEYLGILPVTPNWMWLSIPIGNRETFKIVHFYGYRPSAYALLAQGFAIPDISIASVRKIYPQNNSSIEFLIIPEDLKSIEGTNRYIGVKIGHGRLIDISWSVEVHQLMSPII